MTTQNLGRGSDVREGQILSGSRRRRGDERDVGEGLVRGGASPRVAEEPVRVHRELVRLVAERARARFRGMDRSVVLVGGVEGRGERAGLGGDDA